MQIRELRLNIQFEYTRDIRKYIYDIETMLRENNFCDSLNSVPALPDDVEPQVERLSTIKNEDIKDIHIFISQASLIILFVYKSSIKFNNIFNKDVKYISDISKKLKNFIKTLNPNFKINYEGLIIAASRIVVKDDDILADKLQIAPEAEEERKRVVKKLDAKHFLTIEKSIMRTYSPKQNINSMAIKYDFDSYIGWSYILVIEVNNKQEYNVSKDDKKDIELDLDFAKENVSKHFYKEAI